MIVAVSGHRPSTLDVDYDEIHEPIFNKLKELLKELKPEKAITGMALGTDTYAALACIELNIPFMAAIPFIAQYNVWPDECKRAYYKILDKASEIKVISGGSYADWKYQKRNEFMVDNSDLLIAVFDGSEGGTSNCVDYALKNNKKVIIINPKEL